MANHMRNQRGKQQDAYTDTYAQQHGSPCGLYREPEDLRHSRLPKAKKTGQNRTIQRYDWSRGNIDDPVGERVKAVLPAQAIMAQHHLVHIVVGCLRGAGEGKS
jgi:hypothetical protein